MNDHCSNGLHWRSLQCVLERSISETPVHMDLARRHAAIHESVAALRLNSWRFLVCYVREGSFDWRHYREARAQVVPRAPPVFGHSSPVQWMAGRKLRFPANISLNGICLVACRHSYATTASNSHARANMRRLRDPEIQRLRNEAVEMVQRVLSAAACRGTGNDRAQRVGH